MLAKYYREGRIRMKLASHLRIDAALPTFVLARGEAANQKTQAARDIAATTRRWRTHIALPRLPLISAKPIEGDGFQRASLSGDRIQGGGPIQFLTRPFPCRSWPCYCSIMNAMPRHQRDAISLGEEIPAQCGSFRAPPSKATELRAK